MLNLCVQQKLLYTLIALMSLSLAGIIAVQIYWIVDSINGRNEQFSFAVRQSLVNVAKEIEDQEVEYYYRAVNRAIDSLDIAPNSMNMSSLLMRIRDANVDEAITYSNSIQGESYKLNAPILDIEMDSVMFTKLLNRRVTTIKRNASLDGAPVNSEESYEKLYQWDMLSKKMFMESIADQSSSLPITQRVTNKQVHDLLSKELKDRQINSNFEFAIHQDNFPTRIQSPNFDIDTYFTWGIPVFSTDSANNQSYKLLINLPGRQKFILSSVLGMAGLSLVFTLIIVIAYSSAISQLFQQRQISQIKTDFINNMTHEFKTPIATINLALDSLKHPKISSDPEKVANYLRMIREENKRMHSQVENVLRISKLEKNDLDIQKENLDLSDLLEDSISHIALILEQRGGSLHRHFGALRTSVLANESHLTNVFVNVLENAIKYTDETEAPIIDVYTENVRDKIVIKIRDQGIGMSKSAQRKVFQKFFREHTGDIHNVKGHGLGLAYAQRIVNDHHGEIYVESEKGQGSTFIINLPLIT
ncbi:two-component sensor histidine kinase [Flavobacteria bacterium BBFL7]|nr:two-component sensor histidine kinase [Flavobacteria bacterium BBFL7]